jgi:prolyl oligopeptidase
MRSEREFLIPVAESARDVLHGVQVEDPFRWLEDQDSPATRAFIRAEQDVYRKYLGAHEELRASIENRVKELLTVEIVDLPMSDKRGGLLYLKRKADEEQKAIYRRGESGVEDCVLSGEMLGCDMHRSLAIVQVSPDGRYLVFGVRVGGEDVQEIGIFDLEKRTVLKDRLPRGFYRGLVFDDSREGFYYVHEETQGRYQERRTVRHHVLGNDLAKDDEVFHAGDGPALRLIVQGAEDGSSLGYTVISLQSEPDTRFFIHRLPLADPPRQIVCLKGATFGGRLNGDVMEAVTTYAAPLGRVVSFSLTRPNPEGWKDVISDGKMRLLKYERWNKAFVVHFLDGLNTVTRVYSASGDFQREFRYPAHGTAQIGQIDVAHGRLFYEHSDATNPSAIYAVDLSNGESALWWQQSTPVQRVGMEVESLEYSSSDGVQIPITLIRQKGIVGPCPVLLSAYGSGGVNNTTRFSVLVTILVEAGFSCAIAHVRGGGEGGQQWYLAAQKTRKQKSVDDLIAAGQWLLEKQYTTCHHLGVAGQSNGALLALCAIVQRPELFRAAMALGPLADLIRFHLFGVARGFVAELGSPDDPEEFGALYRLSPYHKVDQATRYPAILIISGDRDKRCDALHARKMIARLHEATSQEHPILLDYLEERGHKPVLSLTERIRSLSDRLTFLIAELGTPLPLSEVFL